MPNHLIDSVDDFEMIDGEVNFQAFEDINQDFNNSGDKKVNKSTNFETPSSDGSENESSNQEHMIPEFEIVSNERYQEEQDGAVLDTQEEESEESFNHLQNGTFESITVTDYRIIDENLSVSAPSENTIQSQTTLPSVNESTERNDSKNVPKGMMKAFGHMILGKDPNTIRILKDYFDRTGESYEEFKKRMRLIRQSSKISISEIRSLLTEGQFAGTMRKLGCYFLRKRFLNHIFNSKMEKKHIHMKYIPKWIEIFKNPSEFTSLK